MSGPQASERQLEPGQGLSALVVCDNLAFSLEIVISKRHTRFGSDRFKEGIAAAIGSLNDYRAIEAQRIATLQLQSLPDNTAESIVLRASQKGSHHSLSDEATLENAGVSGMRHSESDVYFAAWEVMQFHALLTM